MRRDRAALGFGGLFIAIVLFCLAAPLWADQVAHTGPNQKPSLVEHEARHLAACYHPQNLELGATRR